MLRWYAFISGVVGLVADLFLIAFYIAYFGFEVGGFLGTINDVLIVVQYVALVPVVLELGRRMPGDARARRWTRAGLVAAVAVIVLQVALVTGLMPFEIQVVPVSVSTIVAMCWAGGISGAGARTGVLRAPVVRLGRFLVAALPVAGAAFAVGFGVTLVSGVQWAWIAGGLPGVVVWVLFPVWAVRLARGLTTGAPSETPPPAGVPRTPGSAGLRAPRP